MMNEYRKSYLTLFNDVTDALQALRAQRYSTAETLLIQAQCKAEEAFLSIEDEEGE